MLSGGGVMRAEALDEVARAAELPRSPGEAAEGWPPRLAWPVGYEGEDTGAGVVDMPEPYSVKEWPIWGMGKLGAYRW